MNRRVLSLCLSILVLFGHVPQSNAVAPAVAAAAAGTWIATKVAAIGTAIITQAGAAYTVIAANATALYASASTAATVTGAFLTSPAGVQTMGVITSVGQTVLMEVAGQNIISNAQSPIPTEILPTPPVTPNATPPAPVQSTVQPSAVTPTANPTATSMPIDTQVNRPSHLTATSTTHSHTAPLAVSDSVLYSDPSKGATLGVAHPPHHGNGAPAANQPFPAPNSGQQPRVQMSTNITINQGPVINERAALANHRQLQEAFANAHNQDGSFNPGAYNENIARSNGRTLQQPQRPPAQPAPKPVVPQGPSAGQKIFGRVSDHMNQIRQRNNQADITQTINKFLAAGDVQSAALLRDLAVSNTGMKGAPLAAIDTAIAATRTSLQAAALQGAAQTGTTQLAQTLTTTGLVNPQATAGILPKVLDPKKIEKLSWLGRFAKNFRDFGSKVIRHKATPYAIVAGIAGGVVAWAITSQPAANLIAQHASTPNPSEEKLKRSQQEPGNSSDPEKPDDKDKKGNSGKLANPNKKEFKKDDIPHIFANREGHLPNTHENQKLLIDLSSESSNFLGIDQYGTEWYAKILSDGKQLWSVVRDNIIRNGGLNQSPKTFNPKTGLCSPLLPKK